MHRRKTLALGLAAAALTACGLAYAFDADSPESLQHVPVPTRIDCVGLACFGNGGPVPRNWSYWVMPETNGVHVVEMGIDVPAIAASSVVMPAGWAYTIVAGGSQDNKTYTAHGNISTPLTACNYLLRFFQTNPTSTNKMVVPFQLGFNGGFSPHQVEWQASPVSVGTGASSWARPVGTGLGPVHTPALAHQPDDAPANASCDHGTHAH